MSDKMTITFWGVRGSYPMAGASTVHYGGNTSCVEVSVAGHTIIFDAGTGIIALGKELARRSYESGVPIQATLLFSHMHHDHTQGFPFFAPTRIPSAQLHIFGPDIYRRAPEEILVDMMTPPTFPVTFRELSSNRTVRSIRETNLIRIARGTNGPIVDRVTSTNKPIQAQEDEVIIRIMRSYAHPGGVLFYRVEWQNRAIVYATDTEGYFAVDQRLVRFAQRADLLIHDAQYTEDHYLGLKPGYFSTQGWGHSTPSIACDVAEAAKVKQLAIFHYDPTYDDQTIAEIESRIRQRLPNAIAPYEGLKITLSGEQKPSYTTTATSATKRPRKSLHLVATSLDHVR